MLSSTSVLVASVTLVLGVSVAVQFTPPLLVVRLLKLPFGTVTSAVVKPEIASVKIKVTVAVSPIFNAGSLIVMLLAKAGLTVSIA